MALKVGGTEVITNARQLSNIASVDATTVAALGTAGVGGGGGSFDAVASGTIANGALVSLNADGTVSTTTQAVGNSTEFGASVTSVAAAFDSSANKVVVAYRDTGDSNKGKAVVGTISANSITFGTPVLCNGSTDGNGAQRVDFVSVCYDPNANKTAIFFQHDGDSDKLKGSVGTISETSISFGTTATLDNSGAKYIDSVFDPDTNQIIVLWQDKSNNQGACNVVAISGTDISTSHVGSPFGSVYNERGRVVYDTNSNKVVFFGINDSSIASNAGRGRAVVGTNTSSSISFGSVTTFNTTGDDSGEEAQQQFGVAFDSTANKVVVAFRDARDGNKGKAKTGTVSGTSITFGATSTFSSTNTTEVNAVYDSTTNKTFITFRDDGDSDKGIVNAASIIGTDLSFAGKIAYSPSTGNSKWNFPVIDSNSNKLVVVIEDASDSSAGDAIVCDTAGVANFLKWIGFASAAISNSATGTINVLGGINESQSSLEVGATLYLTDAAALSTTAVSGREVGKALSATKILITQGSIT